MKKIIAPTLALLFIAGTAFFYMENRKNQKILSQAEENARLLEEKNEKNAHNVPQRSQDEQIRDTNNISGIDASSGQEAVKKEKTIEIFEPVPDAVVISPFGIQGQAKGWYFEAVFPIRIEDSDGKILGTTQAQAQGEWMTEKFVPFAARIRFDPGEAIKGKLIFEKDNPSGNPENAEKFEIPVRFRDN